MNRKTYIFSIFVSTKYFQLPGFEPAIYGFRIKRTNRSAYSASYWLIFICYITVTEFLFQMEYGLKMISLLILFY